MHGFARGVMGKAMGSAKILQKLSLVIKEDAEILLGQAIDFDSLFHNRDDENEHITFYKIRKTLYGHYGFTDIIFAAVKYLEQYKDKIPKTDQVIVDEFQDFNLLEVSLIELLASRNPILIAGDDRTILSTISRMPALVTSVSGTTTVIHTKLLISHFALGAHALSSTLSTISSNQPLERAFLSGRVDKPYLYFEDEKKEAECKRYPKLSHVQCFATQIPYFIAKTIGEIAEERREKFSVLIIAPTKSRCRSVAKALRKKGLENVLFVDQKKRRRSHGYGLP